MFSIIICTYNREKYIYNALKDVAINEYPVSEYELIVVNNNSTDNTEKECIRFRNDFPQVNFNYFIESQQGLSFARNHGIEAAKGEVLVFLDDDAFISSSYLHNLQEQLSKYPHAMAFGGKITPVFESGFTPAWLSKWSLSFISGLNKGSSVKEFKGKSFPIGANMGFYKKCIDKTGNFNTNLGRTGKNLMGGEEKDLFDRFKKQKLGIYYFPDIEAKHMIPENRTTYDYIKRLGHGVGLSEYVRCKDAGLLKLIARYISEIIKWSATLLLWCCYAIQVHPEKGKVLVMFRTYVTKGLLNK